MWDELAWKPSSHTLCIHVSDAIFIVRLQEKFQINHGLGNQAFPYLISNDHRLICRVTNVFHYITKNLPPHFLTKHSWNGSVIISTISLRSYGIWVSINPCFMLLSMVAISKNPSSTRRRSICCRETRISCRSNSELLVVCGILMINTLLWGR